MKQPVAQDNRRTQVQSPAGKFLCCKPPFQVGHVLRQVKSCVVQTKAQQGVIGDGGERRLKTVFAKLDGFAEVSCDAVHQLVLERYQSEQKQKGTNDHTAERPLQGDLTKQDEHHKNSADFKESKHPWPA